MPQSTERVHVTAGSERFQSEFGRPARFIIPIWSVLLLSLLHVAPTRAEVRIVTSHGEHRMGDRDTREEGARLATEAAKRDALEQVATYLESITVVQGTDVTKDEIRSYTAGLVLVLDQHTDLTLEGETIVVHVTLTSQLDTDQVAQAITILRENEDARRQLLALRQENEQLQQQLEAANQALTVATSADAVQQASRERQDLLNRVQSNAMVAQAWTDWVIASPVVAPYPWPGPARTQALLSIARGLYPASPHVETAQQTMTQRPPAPAQPPAPPAPPSPGSVPRMPTYQTVPAPNSAGPRTLNEVTSNPGEPARLSNQTSGLPSRTMTDNRQVNPLTRPSHGAASLESNRRPASRSVQSLRQFLQPPAMQPAGQLPVAKQLPTTTNQDPPSPHQLPPVPYLNTAGSSAGHASGGGGR
ncbi:MAG TPA: hypothetical protein VFS39_04315 [Nitrospira sp.]|nr:hypothetical protein [Nitrospira sp.]